MSPNTENGPLTTSSEDPLVRSLESPISTMKKYSSMHSAHYNYTECPQNNHPEMSSPPSSECPGSQSNSSSPSGSQSSPLSSSSDTSETKGVPEDFVPLKQPPCDHITVPLLGKAETLNPGSWKVLLLCIEGCHGIGKTTFVDRLRRQGYPVVIENFDEFLAHAKKTHPEYTPNEQLHFAQVNYIYHLREKILETYITPHKRILVLDRSFLSTFLYSLNFAHFTGDKELRGNKKRHFSLFALHEKVVAVIRELHKYCDFHYIIHEVSPHSEDAKIILKQIKRRLLLQPWRAEHHEDNPHWSKRIMRSYNEDAEFMLYLLHGCKFAYNVMKVNDMHHGTFKLVNDLFPLQRYLKNV